MSQNKDFETISKIVSVDNAADMWDMWKKLNLNQASDDTQVKAQEKESDKINNITSSTYIIEEIINKAAINCLKQLLIKGVVITNPDIYLSKNWLQKAYWQTSNEQIKQNCLGMAKMLINHYKIDVNTACRKGDIPLLIFDSIACEAFFKLYLPFLSLTSLEEPLSLFDPKKHKHMGMTIEECLTHGYEHTNNLLNFFYEYRDKVREKEKLENVIKIKTEDSLIYLDNCNRRKI